MIFLHKYHFHHIKKIKSIKSLDTDWGACEGLDDMTLLSHYNIVVNGIKCKSKTITTNNDIKHLLNTSNNINPQKKISIKC